MQLLITSYALKTSCANRVVGEFLLNHLLSLAENLYYYMSCMIYELYLFDINVKQLSFLQGVIPYLPYSKQSKMRNRGAIPSKLIATMLCRAGMCLPKSPSYS